jgi:putative PEP-CTERM system histidine kinase
MITHVPGMAFLHATCAILYGVLAGLILLRQTPSRTGVWLAMASLVTAGWAGAVALSWQDPLVGLAGWLEMARSAAWYGFILHLYRQTLGGRRQLRQAFGTMGLLALLVVGGLPLLDLLSHPTESTFWLAGIGIRLAFAVGCILLLENLYFNTPAERRWNINLLCIALGAAFIYDLALYSDALLFRRISRALFEARAPVLIIGAPLLAIAAARNRRWAIDIHVSRDVVFHSATLVVSGIFLLGLAATGEIFRRGGAEWGTVTEVTLVFGGVIAIAMMVTSGSARSRIRNLLVDHFYSHRYDYRREWMRCIETLTAPHAHTGLQTRAIRAVAGVVDSPGGTLFVRAPEEVAFQWSGSWNTPAVTLPIPPGHGLLAEFHDGDRVVELDEVPDAAEWFAEIPRSWLAVPLKHLGTLIGFVVLTQPRAQFKLDREVFDLLGVVGREVASRIAEQRAAQVLSQTRQLREYSQRFAFVIHDIKNVSGQLSMLLTNAEVHADNPEFQRDMLATVRASVGKITRLLTRLEAERQERSHALITPAERLDDLVAACRAAHGGLITIETDGLQGGAAIGPDSFDATLTHLLNNAIEAGGAAPVTVRLRHEALHIVLDIIDQGPGMAPEFIRDRLFQPFSSTKSGGHGIGAYQARELLREAGGDLLVLSRSGEGTTMRVLLPTISADASRPVMLSA